MILTATSVGIFASIVIMFLSLEERQKEIDAGIRENAVWAAYQADREAGRLIEAIFAAEQSPTPETLDALLLRYDLLYSRAPLLSEGKFSVAMGGDTAIVDKAAEVYDSIVSLAPLIDGVVGDGEAFRRELPRLREHAGDIRERTQRLAQIGNALNNQARIVSRNQVKQTYHRIAVSVGILTLTLAMIVALLAIQLRQLSRARQKLEAMSERNAKAAAEAEAGNHAKSVFLAAMSHEIRTPLNGILGTAEVLADTPLTAAQKQRLETIRHSGNLLLDVISDILDFSKLESGEAKAEIVSFSLADILEPVRSIMAPRAEAAGLDFDIEAPDVSITTDPTWIRQVIVNLVNNAIKFTASGSVKVAVRLAAADRLRVEVRDSGVGIGKKDLPKLFREFSQIDAGARRKFGGTGLGLVICKRLIEALDGRIGVETSQGRGSCFWFEVPAAPIELQARTPSPASTARAGIRHSGRVLVVEDNAINRQVACDLLMRLGVDAFCAEDGQQGIEAVVAERIDLVFMDMQMPVMDGIAATRKLREMGFRTPIVGLTANAFVSDRAACLDAGMNDYLSKPVTRDKLAGILDNWLSGPSDTAKPDDTAPPMPPQPNAQRVALEAELGADTVANLIEQFALNARDLVGKIRIAEIEGDAVARDRALHTLKGSALTLGFDEIARLATQFGGDEKNVIDRLAWSVEAVGRPEEVGQVPPSDSEHGACGSSVLKSSAGT
ncbi:signal transduction histidine kinase [Palleronia aestuarii]|uniref:histidine kinase n=1 Tax=Palleronia aestuarii TaxID=568105 RepID=A0A2W7MYX4_9RHOB|nr:ATP-binding protein [Palleronia aestuarii]PZX11347.1 signal transduction histidine kinase [Palleronia aestuarii]